MKSKAANQCRRCKRAAGPIAVALTVSFFFCAPAFSATGQSETDQSGTGKSETGGSSDPEKGRFFLSLDPTALPPAAAPSAPTQARGSRRGGFSFSLDTTVSYGVSFRLQGPDPSIIGLANGGTAFSVNGDDGNLNYGTGLVSNTSKITTEIEVRNGNFGGFVRVRGFYDFENQHGNRARTPLTDAAVNRIGRRVDLRDAFVWAKFDIGRMPAQIRVGNQVLSCFIKPQLFDNPCLPENHLSYVVTMEFDSTYWPHEMLLAIKGEASYLTSSAPCAEPTVEVIADPPPTVFNRGAVWRAHTAVDFETGGVYEVATSQAVADNISAALQSDTFLRTGSNVPVDEPGSDWTVDLQFQEWPNYTVYQEASHGQKTENKLGFWDDVATKSTIVAGNEYQGGVRVIVWPFDLGGRRESSTWYKGPKCQGPGFYQIAELTSSEQGILWRRSQWKKVGFGIVTQSTWQTNRALLTFSVSPRPAAMNIHDTTFWSLLLDADPDDGMDVGATAEEAQLAARAAYISDPASGGASPGDVLAGDEFARLRGLYTGSTERVAVRWR